MRGSKLQGQDSLGSFSKTTIWKIYSHICNPGLLVYVLMTGLQLILTFQQFQPFTMQHIFISLNYCVTNIHFVACWRFQAGSKLNNTDHQHTNCILKLSLLSSVIDLKGPP